MIKKTNWTGLVLWLVYLSLLAVLLPHTAWAFQQFEPEGGLLIAWFAAVTFEASIAVLTHRLARHIETTPRYSAGRVWLRRLWYQYANTYAVGLLTAVGVSMTANILHAETFAAEGFGTTWLVASFGGVLPFASLLFAKVLSNTVEASQEVDTELQDLRKQLKAAAAKISGIEKERDSLASENKAAQEELQAMQKYLTMWQTINPKTQAAIRYNAGEFETLKEAASAAGVSESTMSRTASAVNGISTK